MPFFETASQTTFTQGEGRTTNVNGQSTTGTRLTTKQNGARKETDTVDGRDTTRTERRDFGASVKLRIIIMGGVTSYSGGVSPCS